MEAGSEFSEAPASVRGLATPEPQAGSEVQPRHPESQRAKTTLNPNSHIRSAASLKQQLLMNLIMACSLRALSRKGPSVPAGAGLQRAPRWPRAQFVNVAVVADDGARSESESTPSKE